MSRYPETIKTWLDLQDGKRPIIGWWEPINPEETIFRVGTSLGVFIVRNCLGDIIARKESSS